MRIKNDGGVQFQIGTNAKWVVQPKMKIKVNSKGQREYLWMLVD